MSLFEVENYVIIDDMYMGKIIKKIWNGYGVIVKLDNDPTYTDSTIIQYQLLNDLVDNSDMKGYMLVKSDNKMRLINKNNLTALIKLELEKERYVYINNKIDNNFIFFKKNILANMKSVTLSGVPVIPIVSQTQSTSEKSTKSIKLVDDSVVVEPLSMGSILGAGFDSLIGGSNINEQLNKLGTYINTHDLTHYITQPQQIQQSLPIFQSQQLNNVHSIKRLDTNIVGGVYNPYLGNMQPLSNLTHNSNVPQLMNTNLLINEQLGSSKKESLDEIRGILGIFDDDKLYAKEAEQLNILEHGQRLSVIKPSIKAVLEKFEKIDPNLYLDLTNTLLYKHIISDNKIDNVSFGIQLIKKIKDILINIQKSIKFEDGRSLLEQINLFAYLKFKIAGGYIIIENENYDLENIKRVITRDTVPNLKLLESQYDQSINYKILSNIILRNKSTLELQKNKDIVTEALNILAQDYFICLQTRVEYLLWTLTRLILCWYSDPILNEHIFKIKILINLY